MTNRKKPETNGWIRSLRNMRLFYTKLHKAGGPAVIFRRENKKYMQGQLNELCTIRDKMNECIEYLERDLEAAK